MSRPSEYYRLQHEKAQMYPQPSMRQRNVSPKARRADPFVQNSKDDDDESKYLEYFKGVGRTLVINLERNPGRFGSLCRRMGPWSIYLHRFIGTDGAASGLRSYWQQQSLLLPENAGQMGDGQCGCYDSHMRVWREIASGRHTTLVLEDDADVAYSADLLTHVNKAIVDMEMLDPEWDILYIGYNESAHVRRVGMSSVGYLPSKEPYWLGTWAYILTPRGAGRLLLGATPVVAPVDVYMSDAARRGMVRAYVACPLKILTVEAASNTRA